MSVCPRSGRVTDAVFCGRVGRLNAEKNEKGHVMNIRGKQETIIAGMRFARCTSHYPPTLSKSL